MTDYWDVAVIGGGASGMAAALAASSLGDRVLVIEKSNALGRKISASGNGRCNLMNTGTPRYYGDASFAEHLLSLYGKKQLMLFWNSLGLLLYEEPGSGRIYPFSLQASTVMEVLKAGLRRNHVTIKLQACVQACEKLPDGRFLVRTDQEQLYAGRVIIAAGGAAYPRLGGCTYGYGLLGGFGHTVLPVFPALCPLETDTKSISGLEGIRIRCGVRLKDDHDHELHRESGEILFTRTGISGICAMQMARQIPSGGAWIELDFCTTKFRDQEELRNELVRRRQLFSDQPADSFLTGFLTPKLAFAVIKQAGITLKNHSAGALTDQELSAVADKLHSYRIRVTGVKGMENAQVTAGGAICDEFDMHTMESRLVKGLYAAGEVLNVDGDCGGFNLMFAFASGILAGLGGRKERTA